MKIMNLVASTTLAFVVACGGGASSDFEAFHKLDSDKAAAFAVGGKDCKAKAKSVGDWRTANTAKYNELRKKLGEAWGKEPPKEIIEKYGAEMKANKKAVIDAMFECSSDPDFSKMMDTTKDKE